MHEGSAEPGGVGGAQDPVVISDRELLRRLAWVGIPNFPNALGSRLLGLFGAALVGHLNDTNALAAVGLSNVIINITGFSVLSGLASGISTLSSQAWGHKSYHAVGLEMQRGFLILLCFADLPLILLWLSAEHLLVALGQPREVAELVGIYTRIRLPGILCETANTVVSKTLSSIGNTRIPALSGIVTGGANIVFSFLLIPHIGFVGAPITATLCDALQVFFVCLLAWRDADFRRCWGGFSRAAWRGWAGFLRVSCPAMALQCVEWWTWDLQAFLAGLISELAQAAQSVAPQIADLQYSMGQSIGTAATTVVGNLLGENKPREAQRAGLLAIIVLCICMTVQGCIFVAIMEKLPYIFTPDAAVVSTCMKVMPVCLIFSYLDSHQAVMCGVLNGAGKQAVAAPIVFCCYWVIGVPLGSMLAFGLAGLPAIGFPGLWIGMLVAVICHNVAFVVVLFRIDWCKTAIEVQERMTQEPHEVRALDMTSMGTSLVDAA